MRLLKQPLRAARTAILLASAAAAGFAWSQERRNYFDDPFVQATSSLAQCPVPEGPLLTESELRERAHVRAQHGGSCYLSGRCRLPNSYLYDKEIVPRVAQYIQRDGRFDDTSVWVLGQRRVVTLKGCVQSREQAQALEQAVVLVDDVMNVVNELMVGTQGRPPYDTAPGAGAR
jgi:hypothetical protein